MVIVRADVIRRIVLCVCALMVTVDVSAQSSFATLSGLIFDEQRSAVAQATVTLTNLDTGATRLTTSDRTGTFRLSGLAPGRYELRATHDGFTPAVQTPLTLAISEEAKTEVVLRIGAIGESVIVSGSRLAGTEPTKTTLGRTFTAQDIDSLPVPGRDFSTLAVLTPGVLPDLNQGGGSAPNLTGFATAAQNGRNNTIMVDGLNHDDALPGAMRGIVSLEAVREFIVSTNGFAAEYGQASGAVVNVVTRSGTNTLASRMFYYHRDDDWDATPGSTKLAVPPLDKARLEQRVAGGSIGGPIVRNRAFFFASIEHLHRETDHVVTSAKLGLFRPDDSATLPQRTRNPNLLGRADLALSPANSLTIRYRFDDGTATNRFTEADVRLGTSERAHDLIRRDQDLGIVDTHVLGSTGVNEFRVLFGRRFVDLNVDGHCPGCPAENRPSIRLGKSFNLPQLRTQDRWQFADTVTRLFSSKLGQHSAKAGFDLSFVKDVNDFPLNFAGTYTFTHDLLFDANNADTYPSQFTNSTGSPYINLEDRMVAMFVQDQWQPSSRLTVNGGFRWDYEDAPGIAHDRNNLAPRLGVTFDLTGNATTIVRASYGHYYDQVLLLVAREVEQARSLVQARIDNPGYPDDPSGPNPRRTGNRPLVPSTTRYGDNMKTPLAAQGTVGVQRNLGARTLLTVDGVWARGWHLLAGHDLNYPDLTDPLRRRPNPDFVVIQAYETRGNSWYSALQAAVMRKYANRFSYYVGYTLSSSERDTEDFRFAPQDQRDYAADRGPGANDSRHRLVANMTADLPFAFRAAGVFTARTALPYNVTTGLDDNRDTYFTDRPPGVGRNSGRGDSFWQADARISRTFLVKRTRLEVLGEVFNIANHRNWIGQIGDRRSAQFGNPTAAMGAREIQLGLRLEF